MARFTAEITAQAAGPAAFPLGAPNTPPNRNHQRSDSTWQVPPTIQQTRLRFGVSITQLMDFLRIAAAWNFCRARNYCSSEYCSGEAAVVFIFRACNAFRLPTEIGAMATWIDLDPHSPRRERSISAQRTRKLFKPVADNWFAEAPESLIALRA
jgi:hypothetical protein